MLLTEVRAVVIDLIGSPVKITTLTFRQGYFNIIETLSLPINIFRPIHICVLMEYKLSIGVVIIIESLIIDVKKHVEALLAILKKKLRGVRLPETVLLRGGRNGVFQIKFIILAHGPYENGEKSDRHKESDKASKCCLMGLLIFEVHGDWLTVVVGTANGLHYGM